MPTLKIHPSTFKRTSPRCYNTGGAPVMAAADGTNATPVATETYYSEIPVFEAADLTGIAIFNGATVGTDKYVVGLYDVNGTLIANSALAGTTTAGADGYQRLPFTAAITIPPGTYYVALQVNGNTDRYNAHPVGNFGAGKGTGTTFGTLAAITPPTTFTADLGPIASLY